ncbi:MAG: DUF2079 domain-containing protein [Lentisphaeria bacterium]|nr:MAG: DUF2079 domain-containing protein [Lentisphaeria bacterium]
MTVSYYIAAAAAVAAAVPFAAAGYAVRRPLPERAARAVVFGTAALFALVYWALGMLKYRADLFGLWDFGIYDSMLHIAAQGGGLLRDFRGGAFDHFSPAALLLLPGYLLWDSPHWLIAFQPFAMAAAAIPLYFAGLRLLRNPAYAALPPLLYLFNPYFARLALFDFHIECLFPLWFALGFLAWTRHRMRWFLFWMLTPAAAQGGFRHSARRRRAVDAFAARKTPGRRALPRRSALLDLLHPENPLSAAGQGGLLALRKIRALRSDPLRHARQLRHHACPIGSAARSGGVAERAAPLRLPPPPLLAGNDSAGVADARNSAGQRFRPAAASLQPLRLGAGRRPARGDHPRLRQLRILLRKKKLTRYTGAAAGAALGIMLAAHILFADLPQNRYYIHLAGYDTARGGSLLSIPFSAERRTELKGKLRNAAELKRVTDRIPDNATVVAQNETGLKLLRRCRVFNVPGPEKADFYLFDRENFHRYESPEELNALLMRLLRDPSYRFERYGKGILLFRKISAPVRMKR